MLTLTLQTSDRNSAVAIFDGPKCLSQTDQASFAEAAQLARSDLADTQARGAAPSGSPGGSALLLPMVQHCFQETNITASDVGLIAVTKGPGMFTPLRVGVVAAKTMAWVNSTPLVGVDVLEALALAMTRRLKLPIGQVVEAVVNAQRKQLFLGRFEVTANQQVQQRGESRLVVADEWAQNISPKTCVTGAGLNILKSLEIANLSQQRGATVDQPEFRSCDLSTMADIAQQRFQSDDLDDPWKLTPVYFRPSAAEEVLAAQSGAS